MHTALSLIVSFETIACMSSAVSTSAVHLLRQSSASQLDLSDKFAHNVCSMSLERESSEISEASFDVEIVPVLFYMHNPSKGMPFEDVILLGSWSDWSVNSKLLKKDDGFAGFVDVPVGTHQFKFIADGKWMTSDEFDIETDGAGNFNNVIHVASRRAYAESAHEGVGRALSESALRTALSETTAGVVKQDPTLAKSAISPLKFVLKIIFSPLQFFLRCFGFK